VVRLYKEDGSNVDISRRKMIEDGQKVVRPGTHGAELVDELKPNDDIELNSELLLNGDLQSIGEREWIMYKPRWGAFYETPLETHLDKLSVDTLVVAGCNFPNCPRTTIYEASERDFRIVFVPDATSGTYERGLIELENIGISLKKTKEIISWFSS
jgi:nicotinamidase-related amidase